VIKILLHRSQIVHELGELFNKRQKKFIDLHKMCVFDLLFFPIVVFATKMELTGSGRDGYSV